MEFSGFDWDHGNREKCCKHGLTQLLIESVFQNPVLVLPDKQNPQNERRFRAIGTTLQGRKAFVIFTLHLQGQTSLLRPINARYMHKEEVDHYEKAYPQFPK